MIIKTTKVDEVGIQMLATYKRQSSGISCSGKFMLILFTTSWI